VRPGSGEDEHRFLQEAVVGLRLSAENTIRALHELTASSNLLQERIPEVAEEGDGDEEPTSLGYHRV